MPDSPKIVAEELRYIAKSSAEDLEGLITEEMVEWDAANKIDAATRALREIRDGAPDPRGLAAITLMELNDE